jgi:hypothetical protein
MILVGFLIPVSSCISLFRAWVLVSSFSMPPVMGCQNPPVVDVLFSSRYCVFVLVFLYRMAWTCTGNLMPRKGLVNGIREFRVQAVKREYAGRSLHLAGGFEE